METLNPQSLQRVQYGGTSLEFAVLRQERKHVRITVHPDRRIEIRCPLDTDDSEIEATVRRRASWIIDQRDYFLSFEPRYTLKQYVPGESHHYLGRQYRLRWLPIQSIDADQQATCALRGGFFEIRCHLREELAPLLKTWFLVRAQEPLPAFAKTWIEFFQEVHQVSPASLRVAALKNRWGSCTPSGNIVLNPRLIQHRRSEIEYVIVHELCHLVVPNHGRKFVDLLRRTLPDHKVRKERLEYGR